MKSSVVEAMASVASHIPDLAKHVGELADGNLAAIVPASAEVFDIIAKLSPQFGELWDALRGGSEEAQLRVKDILRTREGLSGQAAAKILAMGEPAPEGASLEPEPPVEPAT